MSPPRPRSLLSLFALVACMAAAPPAAAQDRTPTAVQMAAAAEPSMPRVVLVELDAPVAALLASAYGAPTERLWCATEWTAIDREGASVMHVTAVREEAPMATRRSVSLLPSSCRDASGKVLPTVHSHPGGSCQFGPGDVEAVLARMAAFDGVLCGPRSHAWLVASTLLDAVAWRQHLALASATASTQ